MKQISNWYWRKYSNYQQIQSFFLHNFAVSYFVYKDNLKQTKLVFVCFTTPYLFNKKFVVKNYTWERWTNIYCEKFNLLENMKKYCRIPLYLQMCSTVYHMRTKDTSAYICISHFLHLNNLSHTYFYSLKFISSRYIHWSIRKRYRKYDISWHKNDHFGGMSHFF